MITPLMTDSARLVPRQVVLLAPKTIAKTTSGKIQRSKVKQLYVNGLLKPIYPSKGEAESWWASLQRTVWGSPAVTVQDSPNGIDLQPQVVQQAATSHPPPSTTVDSGTNSDPNRYSTRTNTR